MFGLGKTTSDKMLSVLYESKQSQPAKLESVEQNKMTLQEASDFFQYENGWGYGDHNGEKFAGETGFGGNTYLLIDYWALRAKSAEVFERVLYARGIIRRLVTNIVVTGLALESTPAESILGLGEGDLDDWTDLTEEAFELWANDPKLCDFEGRRTFGELQRDLKREALVCGDVLVVRRMNSRLKVPQIQIVDGNLVQTPLNYDEIQSPVRIEHGVELDKDDRQVAFWVTQEDGSSKRLPAFSSNGATKLSWLYYGSDKRMNQVRGQPILSLILQSLKELDRFRDSAQRKAVVNAMIALFVTKDGDGVGTRPVAAGATRRTKGTTPGEGGQGHTSLSAQSMNPGLAIDRLAPGEKIQGFQNTGADQTYSDFENGIVQGLAWALEIPPEILQLSFGSNYSASQAAINEFAMFLQVQRTQLGDNFCRPFYQEWLVSEVLAERVSADGLLDSWRDRTGAGRYRFSAWVKSCWNGQVKPSTDMHKLGKGLQLMVNNGFLSFDKASRIATGTKWRDNIKKQKREREVAFEAKVPLSSDAGQFTDAEIAEQQDVGPA